MWVSNSSSCKGHSQFTHPVKRVEQENAASKKTSADFVNPGVVEGHPGRLVGAEMAGLDTPPELRVGHVLAAIIEVS